MYTMEDLWFHVLENEQDMPETKLARLKFQEQMEKLLSSADWREAGTSAPAPLSTRAFLWAFVRH